MADAVLFGDIETALIGWLDDRLSPRSYTKVPPATKSSLPFVIVSRLGGPKNSVVTEQATVTIEAYGKSDKGAHDLAQLARQAVASTPGNTINGIVFYKVAEFAGPARLPSPIGDYPRFVFTVSITVRALP